MALLEVRDLKIHYPVGTPKLFGGHDTYVKAVDGVSFDIEKGSVLGVVGESGCGKSTLAKGVMQLAPIKSGSIRLQGKDLLKMSPSELKKYRSNFQMVFQDPEASLNPRLTVGEIIEEPLLVYESQLSSSERQKKVQGLMDQVGLSPYMIRRYPHEFSGGQRQRICIARSLAVNPSLVVCDEAVSALDVSIQAQIVNLLNDLKKEFGLTYMFISHDLSVTRYISDYIMVMYLGKIAEFGPTKDIIENPQHPYTKALISAVPEYGRTEPAIELKGEIPSPMRPPAGCRFHTRCPIAKGECKTNVPELLKKSHVPQEVACHFVQ